MELIYVKGIGGMQCKKNYLEILACLKCLERIKNLGGNVAGCKRYFFQLSISKKDERKLKKAQRYAKEYPENLFLSSFEPGMIFGCANGEGYLKVLLQFSKDGKVQLLDGQSAWEVLKLKKTEAAEEK